MRRTESCKTLQVKSKQETKRTKEEIEEHISKNAQTGSKKVFIHSKRKKVVMKLVRSLNDKSRNGEGRWPRTAKLAQRDWKSCLP